MSHSPQEISPVLVLASASPRRRELLQNAGIPFTAHPANVTEIFRAGESPRSVAERLAREKAEIVARQFPSRVVLGADTVVVVEGAMLGKPENEQEAASMLRALSGKTHDVVTGVCLAKIGSAVGKGSEEKFELLDVRSELTRVSMTELGEENIQAYVASGEPMDKAGAYAIQGIASRWIPRIEGDYANVVGLPVALVYRMLRANGISV